MVLQIIKDKLQRSFYRSLASRLQVANIQFDAVYRNLGGKIDGLRDEFDLILVNGDTGNV
ncbi:MAG: hypothetical protein R3E08_04440 [Thiotrichaceae bacterium]